MSARDHSFDPSTSRLILNPTLTGELRLVTPASGPDPIERLLVLKRGSADLAPARALLSLYRRPGEAGVLAPEAARRLAALGLIVPDEHGHGLVPGLRCEAMFLFRTRDRGRRAFVLGMARPGSRQLPIIETLLAFIAREERDPQVDLLGDMPADELRRLRDFGALLLPDEVPADARVELADERLVEAARATRDHQVFFAGSASDLVASEPVEPVFVSTGISTGEPVGERMGDGSSFLSVQESLGLSRDALLVAAPLSGVRVPVSLGPGLAATWARCRDAARGTLPALPRDARDSLRAHGLLVPSGAQDARDTYRAQATEALQRHGHAVLRSLFTPVFSAAMQRYCRRLWSEGYLFDRELDIDRRWRKDDPVMTAIHASLEPVISAIVAPLHGPCRRSYSYYAVYERGADLPPHTDRDQCRWNVSIVFDTMPAIDREAQWPIFLRAGGAPVPVRLGLGDGVLYAGTEVEHWRAPLQEADSVAVCFFHFVDIDFEGSLA